MYSSLPIPLLTSKFPNVKPNLLDLTNKTANKQNYLLLKTGSDCGWCACVQLTDGVAFVCMLFDHESVLKCSGRDDCVVRSGMVMWPVICCYWFCVNFDVAGFDVDECDS